MDSKDTTMDRIYFADVISIFTITITTCKEHQTVMNLKLLVCFSLMFWAPSQQNYCYSSPSYNPCGHRKCSQKDFLTKLKKKCASLDHLRRYKLCFLFNKPHTPMIRSAPISHPSSTFSMAHWLHCWEEDKQFDWWPHATPKPLKWTSSLPRGG